MSEFDIIQQSWFDEMEASALNEVLIEDAKRNLKRIADVVDDHRSTSAHINADADLSGKGRANRLGELANESAERLERIVANQLNDLDRAIGDLQDKVRPQSPASDPVLEHLREREIRDQLRTMDAIEVIGLYLDLAQSGRDDATMRAIEDAPAAFPLISDSAVLEQGKRARGVRQSPTVAGELAVLKRLRATLESARDTARASLGLPLDDPVSLMAKAG